MSRHETLEQYLARGGAIKRVRHVENHLRCRRKEGGTHLYQEVGRTVEGELISAAGVQPFRQHHEQDGPKWTKTEESVGELQPAPQERETMDEDSTKPTRTCAICDEVLRDPRPQQKYCGVECRREAEARKKGRTRRKRRLCKRCGAPLPKGVPSAQRYCPGGCDEPEAKQAANGQVAMLEKTLHELVRENKRLVGRIDHLEASLAEVQQEATRLADANASLSGQLQDRPASPFVSVRLHVAAVGQLDDSGSLDPVVRLADADGESISLRIDDRSELASWGQRLGSPVLIQAVDAKGLGYFMID